MVFVDFVHYGCEAHSSSCVESVQSARTCARISESTGMPEFSPARRRPSVRSPGTVTGRSGESGSAERTSARMASTSAADPEFARQRACPVHAVGGVDDARAARAVRMFQPQFGRRVDEAAPNALDKAGKTVDAVGVDPVARVFRKNSGAERTSFFREAVFVQDPPEFGEQRFETHFFHNAPGLCPIPEKATRGT